jgi:hypothetical protein
MRCELRSVLLIALKWRGVIADFVEIMVLPQGAVKRATEHPRSLSQRLTVTQFSSDGAALAASLDLSRSSGTTAMHWGV